MKKIAFMFCGGGSQYSGMMKDLYETIPECNKVFAEADSVLNMRLSSLCFSGNEGDLSSTSVMIPAIYTADLVAYAAISAKGIKADYMLGFSLGEWAALTASGAVKFKDALDIVRFRSKAMERSTPESGGGMGVVLKRSNEFVEDICRRVTEGVVYPANYNYEGQVTVSGDEAGLAELARIAREEHVIYKRLPVFVPSHCILMNEAMGEMRNMLSSFSFAPPICPIVSNSTAEIESDTERLKENAIYQLVKPVLFEQSVISLLNEGVNCFIELGPGKTLSKFVKKITEKQHVDCNILNVEDTVSLNNTLKQLG